MPTSGMVVQAFSEPNGGHIFRNLSERSFGYFAGVPTASVSGWAKGGIAIDITNGNVYRNSGTITVAVWTQLNPGVDLSGLLATAAEINRNDQASTREVLAGATLTLSQALHDGKTIAMPAVCAITLPASTGSGSRFKLYQKIAATTVTITAAAADLYGVAWALSDNSAAVLAYEAAGSTIITHDGSTRGGRKGHITELEDVATNLWIVRTMGAHTGTEATPFS